MRETVIILTITIMALLASCQNSTKSKYNYSEIETEQFLNEIIKNAKVIITDITEIEKQPTDKLLIYTRFSLSKQQLEKLENDVVNKDDDISDFTTYIFMDYELTNEKNEKLRFVDKGRAVYLQEFGQWTYNNVLCQNLGIDVNLDKKFEKLKGHITIVFEMPKKKKKEVKIPVNISIYDSSSRA